MRDVCAVRLLHEEQIRSISSNFAQAGLLEPWIWTFEDLLNCLTRRRASPLTNTIPDGLEGAELSCSSARLMTGATWAKGACPTVPVATGAGLAVARARGRPGPGLFVKPGRPSGHCPVGHLT